MNFRKGVSGGAGVVVGIGLGLLALSCLGAVLDALRGRAARL